MERLSERQQTSLALKLSIREHAGEPVVIKEIKKTQGKKRKPKQKGNKPRQRSTGKLKTQDAVLEESEVEEDGDEVDEAVNNLSRCEAPTQNEREIFIEQKPEKGCKVKVFYDDSETWHIGEIRNVSNYKRRTKKRNTAVDVKRYKCEVLYEGFADPEDIVIPPLEEEDNVIVFPANYLFPCDVEEQHSTEKNMPNGSPVIADIIHCPTRDINELKQNELHLLKMTIDSKTHDNEFSVSEEANISPKHSPSKVDNVIIEANISPKHSPSKVDNVIIEANIEEVQIHGSEDDIVNPSFKISKNSKKKRESREGSREVVKDKDDHQDDDAVSKQTSIPRKERATGSLIPSKKKRKMSEVEVNAFKNNVASSSAQQNRMRAEREPRPGVSSRQRSVSHSSPPHQMERASKTSAPPLPKGSSSPRIHDASPILKKPTSVTPSTMKQTLQQKLDAKQQAQLKAKTQAALMVKELDGLKQQFKATWTPLLKGIEQHLRPLAVSGESSKGFNWNGSWLEKEKTVSDENDTLMLSLSSSSQKELSPTEQLPPQSTVSSTPFSVVEPFVIFNTSVNNSFVDDFDLWSWGVRETIDPTSQNKLWNSSHHQSFQQDYGRYGNNRPSSNQQYRR